MVGLGMFGLSVLLIGLYVVAPDSVGESSVYSAVGAALVGIGALAHWSYTRSVSMTFFKQGFGYKGQGATYASIRGVRYKLIHVVGGSATYNKGFLHIRLDDGRRISPSMQLEAMDEVIERLIRRSTPLLMAGMLQALEQGQTLTYGHMSEPD